MDKVAFTWHIGICLLVGGVIAYFTPAKWLAASFWVSAALYVNGSLALHEDSIPGGFDNPDGTNTPDSAKGIEAFKYAALTLAVTVALVSVGFLIQEYL